MKKFIPHTYPIKIFFYLLFLICPSLLFAQTVDYGKSFINLSKGLNGGTIEPGDTLEIKATFVVKSGTLDSCGFFDNVPLGTVYIAGTLAVITNEGKIYKSFTDVAGDDCGWLSGTAIRINLGYNGIAGKQATASRRGQIRNTDRPTFFGSTCIMVASYKIRVIAALGTQINIGGGFITYKNGVSPLVISSFPVANAAVFTNSGLCNNSIGANSLGTEFNGTFGSGKNKNRGPSANVPANYTYVPFAANNPNDYYYGITNNTSSSGAGYSIINTWAKPDLSAPSHRVFQLWDIIGDHTGAVSPTLGNPPADTVNNNNGGYMLVINASYRIDSAFNQTISGLCPNTYYEFSVWIRNICSKCGCDSTGKSATAAGYIPTAPGDSSGVKPNLTLAINGVDYYSTGNVVYNGKWIKKGFTYLTGPSQTSFTARIRNNAPGGGGNDWAIDDISVATCTPNLDLKPSPNLAVCYGNQIDMFTIINCYFNNYIYWTWEKSTDNGVTWTNTGVSGTGSPVLVSGQWQYTATYPSFLGDSSVHNNRFRIKVASAIVNLNDINCSFNASTLIQVLVNDCQFVLTTKLKSFTGKTDGKMANLSWVTDSEDSGLYFDIEKSADGVHFKKIGTVNALNNNGGGANYSFIDKEELTEPTYYRIKLMDNTNYKYSSIVSLNTSNANFEVASINNPFKNNLYFDIVTPEDRQATITLFDSYGRQVKQKKEQLHKGINKVTFTELHDLTNGTYILRIQQLGCDKVINKRVIKTTH